MKLNRVTIAVVCIGCICFATVLLYLQAKPKFRIYKGVLATGYFPLDQMIHTHRGRALGVEGVGDFGVAYTLKVQKLDGTNETLYLANEAGQVFGDNTVEEGKILYGFEIGDYIRINGFEYSKRGALAMIGSKKYQTYRILKIESVKLLSSSDTS